MEKISEGAEAKVYASRVFGTDIIVKSRERKRYRNPQLDLSLRKTRTRKEARAMLRASSNGVNVPAVLAAGLFTLYLQRIRGRLLRDAEAQSGTYFRVGEMLGRLHNCGIAHGDFTPANIMIERENAYVIDFGLSEITESIEEKALDLLLMKRSISGKMYARFISGYAKTCKQRRDIEQRLAEIEQRGRYQNRTLE